MTAALAEACSDLAQWLPRAAALIPVPDIAPQASGRSAPGSCPPWNDDAASLTFEVLNGLRDIHAELLADAASLSAHVTMERLRPWSDRAAGERLAAISKLGAADDMGAAQRIQSWVTRIMTLPAIDAAEPDKPVRVRSACPFCRLGDLRMMRRSFRVTCLRLHQCADRNGAHPRGVLEQSRLDGQWRIYWNDGTVT